MKLRKLLTPILTTLGACSVATPLVCLTSCAGDTETKVFFKFDENNPNKEVSLNDELIGTIEYRFVLADGATLPESIEAQVVIKSESSNINIVQCTSAYKKETGAILVTIDYWCKRETTGKSETTFSLKILSTVGTGKDATTYQQIENGFVFTIDANK